MTLADFCVHKNIQTSLDATKPANKPSVLLRMRQQLSFLEDGSLTSCSMAKPKKKKALKLKPERFKLRSDA